MVIFTEEELNGFTVVQLKRLADYYKVAYSRTEKKPELIKKLSEVLSQPGTYLMEGETEQPMSVRVRRIKIQNMEQKDG